MQVRTIKTNEVFPPPANARSGFAKKLPGYVDFVRKLHEGAIGENGMVLELEDKDVKATGAESMSKLGSRVVARLKKELDKCYREGGTKGRNLQIYQVASQVIVRKCRRTLREVLLQRQLNRLLGARDRN